MRTPILLFAAALSAACVDLSSCGGPGGDGEDAPAGVDGARAERPGSQGFLFSIVVSDPRNLLPAAHDDMRACATAALNEWGRYVAGRGTLTVALYVRPTRAGRMEGASTSNVTVGRCKNTREPCTLVEEQAIHRLRTGKDNPAPGHAGTEDVAIAIAPDYWTREIWVDPQPASRLAPVPADRVDAITALAHEFGHAFGMTGFRDLDTFEPADNPPVLSLFDDLIARSSGALTFRGPKTSAEFGPLPLTRTHTTQNVYHYGDPAAPSRFDDGLMNGIVFKRGVRYRVGRVDVRILEDLGVPMTGVTPH